MSNRDINQRCARRALSLSARGMVRFLSLALCCTMAPLTVTAASAAAPTDAVRLRHQLELFIDLPEGDSVTAVRRVAVDTLEVTRHGAGESHASTSRHFIPAAYLDKIVSSAPLSLETTTPFLPRPSPAPTKALIREDYMGGQLGVSAYLYGVALPAVLDLENRSAILLPAFLITGSLAAHAIYSLNNPLTQAEVLGMNYVSTGSIVGSYALMYALSGPGGNTFDAASVLALATYPLSLSPGRRLGERYNDNPLVLSKRMTAAGVFATTGAVLPWVYLESPSGEQYTRLAAGQFMALGIAGHLLGDFYRPGEGLPDGVNTGIFTHMGFGALLGSALVVTMEPDDSRVVTGVIMGSTLAGFAEGLWFFHDRYDDAEKANYAGFGTLGGMLLAGSVAWASEANGRTTLWLLSLGGLGGYTIVYRALSSREVGTGPNKSRSSRTSHAAEGFVKDVSFALAPVAESVRPGPGEPYATRYRVPGLTVRF
jgi:hypothetical protein